MKAVRSVTSKNIRLTTTTTGTSFRAFFSFPLPSFCLPTFGEGSLRSTVATSVVAIGFADGRTAIAVSRTFFRKS